MGNCSVSSCRKKPGSFQHDLWDLRVTIRLGILQHEIWGRGELNHNPTPKKVQNFKYLCWFVLGEIVELWMGSLTVLPTGCACQCWPSIWATKWWSVTAKFRGMKRYSPGWNPSMNSMLMRCSTPIIWVNTIVNNRSNCDSSENDQYMKERGLP